MANKLEAKMLAQSAALAAKGERELALKVRPPFIPVFQPHYAHYLADVLEAGAPMTEGEIFFVRMFLDTWRPRKRGRPRKVEPLKAKRDIEQRRAQGDRAHTKHSAESFDMTPAGLRKNMRRAIVPNDTDATCVPVAKAAVPYLRSWHPPKPQAHMGRPPEVDPLLAQALRDYYRAQGDPAFAKKTAEFFGVTTVGLRKALKRAQS